MAKTIKFNLICDGKPIRTIEDLQNNFSIEDILTYYNNKLLHRWLSVRCYNSQLQSLSEITDKEPIEIIKKLIRIFDITTDEKKVEEKVYILKFNNEYKSLCATFEKENYNTKKIIESYKYEYNKLINIIESNQNDSAIIKAALNEIAKNYTWIFDLDNRNFFYKFFNAGSNLVIMCLLTNEAFRKYYLPVAITDGDGNIKKDKDGHDIYDVDINKDKSDMYQSICKLITTNYFPESLGDNLITFSGQTDSYWKDLEPKGKKYMIICMGAGDYVRSAGNSGGDLAYYDVLNEFVILDGIDYKSNSDVRKLLYMEV